jgi:hypothetical protein
MHPGADRSSTEPPAGSLRSAAAALPAGRRGARGDAGVPRRRRWRPASSRPGARSGHHRHPGRARRRCRRRFTRNQVVAAPIRLSRAHLNATEIGGGGKFGWADAIVATAGSANAATGVEGDADQAEICKAVAAALEHAAGADAGHLDRRHRRAAAVRRSRRDRGAWSRNSPNRTRPRGRGRAMMTTDTKIKLATTTVELPGPDGAPVTGHRQRHRQGRRHDPPPHGHDAERHPDRRQRRAGTLHGLLSPIVQRTWNQLSVDGDTSTNDTVFLLASGASGLGGHRQPRGRRSSAGPSRPWRGRWPASRPPTARAPRRSSPARSAAPPTTTTPGPSPAP